MSKFYFLILLGVCIASDCEVKSNFTVMDCYHKCRLLYNGNRNYFNETTWMCDVVTQCSESQQYNYLTNRCSGIVQDVSDFPKVNNTNKTSDDSGKLDIVKYFSKI